MLIASKVTFRSATKIMTGLKEIAKRRLLKLGYRLERLPATNMGRFHPDVQAALTVKGAPFYTRWSKHTQSSLGG